MIQRFVPQNVGFNAIIRAEYIENHVPAFANELYNPKNPKATSYIDGSYIMILKSTKFRVLRQSYCVHKDRHLLKLALVVAADGYILDIQESYFSDFRNNDAQMLCREYERDNSEMTQWYQGGDIFVIDRGYRDSIPLFEQNDFTYKMSALLGPNKSQLTTEEANQFRLATKTR